MNIRDLDCFIKVYECRSISIASESLFISAQGLSNIITRLEQELGCSLFNRDRAGSRRDIPNMSWISPKCRTR